ncbi:siphovirus Gp157 family protein [Agrobacterium radiobacter]|uniref:siphovirus Gp157 family protein n=1 Tax=Agrobacterium radiobacter TaxID=362 RepID=UPI003CE5123D
MTKPANDNYLAADVANLEALFADMLAAYPELEADEELRADMLEGETNFHAVLTRLVNGERDADSLAKAVAGRISDLQARKSRAERRKEAMRSLMFKLLKAAGVPRVPLAEATISIGKKAAAVEIIDEAALPEAYVRISTSPDKTAIKEALQAGKKVRGAQMGEAGEQLSVRVA